MNTVTGLSPVSAKEFALRITGMSDAVLDNIDIQKASDTLCQFVSRLYDLESSKLLVDEAGRRVDFFAFPYLSYPSGLQQSCKNIHDAMERFYSQRDRNDRIQQKSASLKKALKTLLEREEKKLTLLEEALRDAADAERYRLFGELLSAQQHLVGKGSREVRLPNFYDEDNALITIPLDEKLSPIQNSQRYFKRYRKALASKKTSAEQKELCLNKIKSVEEALFDIEQCETVDDLNDIRRTLETLGILKQDKTAKRNKPIVSKYMQFRTTDGFTVFAGKNSLQNERLTKGADGDDMWLHAKDMPGSHVIIVLNRQPVTQQALMEAANIAAWYSKARGVSVPVDYTYRKYVKKPGGTPTGFVTFTHNKTLLINTSESDIKNLIAL